MPKYPELEKAIEIIKALRHPTTGCPWDLKQNHQSLLKYLIEESYEYIDAVERNNTTDMKEELGDILLQLLLHTTLSEEQSTFNLEDVAKTLSTKIISRHPHVFGDEQDKTIEGIEKRWLESKAKEKKISSFILTEKLLHAPALKSAQNIGAKSKEVNFDWENYHQVLYKVEEEWQEVKTELPPNGYTLDRVEEEIGDLLFSIAQLARHLNLDPEETLRKANKKFLRRFREIEKSLINENKKPTDLTNKEMEKLWEKAKDATKN